MKPSLKLSLLEIVAICLLINYSAHGQDTIQHKLEYDHILLFVNDVALKDSLDTIFTPAEKLTTEHKTQGTIGYYYLFYNTYIELLFLEDSVKAKVNVENFGSDYLSRWIQDEGHSPVGFGMLMIPWPKSKINAGYHTYESSDTPNGEFYLMSNYNKDLAEPMIYISSPNRAYDSIEALEDINEHPEEIRHDLQRYLTHKKDLKRISKIIYTYQGERTINKNTQILQESEMIEVERSNSNSLTLVFDEGTNNQKEFMLTDEIKLIIQY
jgi:hypothetical protein